MQEIKKKEHETVLKWMRTTYKNKCENKWKRVRRHLGKWILPLLKKSGSIGMMTLGPILQQKIWEKTAKIVCPIDRRHIKVKSGQNKTESGGRTELSPRVQDCSSFSSTNIFMPKKLMGSRNIRSILISHHASVTHLIHAANPNNSEEQH